LDVDADFHLYGFAKRDHNPLLHPHVEPDAYGYRRAFDGDTHLFVDLYNDGYAYVDFVQYGVFDLDRHTDQHPHTDRDVDRVCHEHGGA
jgi:hypothetical protein